MITTIQILIKTMRTLISLIAALLTAASFAQDALWQNFVSPQQAARTKLWWFHGETETTREGVDADLQAFAKAGVGGVVYYDQTHGSEQGAFASMSPEWWEMLKYAARRARDLNLTFEVAASNGYVAGGPWITPEMGMQQIVVLHPGDKEPGGFHLLTALSLPADDGSLLDTCIQRSRISLLDDAPALISFDAGQIREVRTISYMVTPRGKGSFGSMNIPGPPQSQYFGAGYIHFPPIGWLECSNDGEQWEKVVALEGVEDIIGHKSRQRTINFPPVSARYFRLNIHDWLGEPSKYRKLEIENVRLMSFDMIDNWEEKSGLRSQVSTRHQPTPDAPAYPIPTVADRPMPIRVCEASAATSRVVRIGYAPTGGHAKHGRSRIVYQGRELQAKTWLEADILNSEAVRLHYNSYFHQVYDTLKAIGCPPQGMNMDSHEAGIANWTARMPEHFKRLRGYDITPWLPALAGYIVESRTATEAFLHDFRQTISQLVSEQFYGTLAELCHGDGVSFTSQAMLGCVNDNVASRGRADKPQGEFWAYQVNGNYDCLDAASAAHLYAKPIASGEAFTDSPYFVPEGDTTTQTRIEGWHRLLRIANLAYCRGVNEFVVCASSYQPWMDRKYDDSKSGHPYIFHRHNPAWPYSREHFWEYQARCSQMLQTGRPVVDLLVYLGEELPLKTLSYKLPVIPEGYQFDVCTLTSLSESPLFANDADLQSAELAHSPIYGAIIVQDRTYVSPQAESLFEQLKTRGMLIIRCDKGQDVAAELQKAGLRPDFRYVSEANPTDRTCFYHRQTSDADVYFIYNHSAHPYQTILDLRTEHRSLELWDPLTAERCAASDTLKLAPYQAMFVVALRSSLR